MAALVFSACHPPQAGPAEFIRWVEDPGNGLKVSLVREPQRWEFMWRPAEYLALLEIGDKASDPSESFRARVAGFRNMQYYSVQATLGSEDRDRWMAYLQDEAERDFHLLDGEEVLPCRLYHMESGHGIRPYVRLLLAFDHPQENKARGRDKTLRFWPKKLGGDPIELTISAKAIESLPHLKLHAYVPSHLSEETI